MPLIDGGDINLSKWNGIFLATLKKVRYCNNYSLFSQVHFRRSNWQRFFREFLHKLNFENEICCQILFLLFFDFHVLMGMAFRKFLLNRCENWNSYSISLFTRVSQKVELVLKYFIEQRYSKNLTPIKLFPIFDSKFLC